MTEPEPSPSPASPSTRLHWRATLFVIVLAWLFVLMPFLFWRGTWFGRKLTDQEIEKYLADSEHPRKAQHALAQIADRIIAHDPTVKRWYPQVERLSYNPISELRMTAAWVMGQDNTVASFHVALLRLLQDPDPGVRQNAALALVRFGDAQARTELRAMLAPFTLAAPRAGTLSFRLKEDDTVNRGTLVARIQPDQGPVVEIRSPLPGRFTKKLLAEGARVSPGDAIAQLSPAPDQVWAALQGLYFFGLMEDLEAVDRYARGVPGMPEKIQQQAALTAKAIRARGTAGGVIGGGPGG